MLMVSSYVGLTLQGATSKQAHKHCLMVPAWRFDGGVFFDEGVESVRLPTKCKLKRVSCKKKKKKKTPDCAELSGSQNVLRLVVRTCKKRKKKKEEKDRKMERRELEWKHVYVMDCKYKTWTSASRSYLLYRLMVSP